MGQGRHFVFSGIGVAGSKETDVFCDYVYEVFVVGDAACEEDAVDLAAQNGCGGSYLFGYCVGHGVVDGGGFGISGLYHVVEFHEGVGSHVCYHTSFPGEHFADLFVGVFT